MKRYVQVALIAIGFDLYWILVVLFRERGQPLWIALAILAYMMLSPALRFHALLLTFLGCGLDAIWAWTGVIRFSSDALLPLWMVALWLMFATVWTSLISTTTLSGGWIILLAATGGPVAYIAGEHLGAITFQYPTFIIISWLAPGWFIIALFSRILAGKRR